MIKVQVTYISPEFFLWRWLSQPALDEDFSAAHVDRCLLRLVYNCCLALVHDGFWRLARSKSCWRLVYCSAARSPHLIKIKVALLAGDVAGRSWWHCAQLPSQNPQPNRDKITRNTRRELRAARWQAAAGKLNWCGVRKYRRMSAVCFPK